MWAERLKIAGAEGDVIVGQDLAPALGRMVSGLTKGPVLVVVDAGAPGTQHYITAALSAHDIGYHLVSVAGGEATKEWRTVMRLYQEAVAAGVRRDGLFLAVGGGAVTDTVGFAAATYLRGVCWVAVPTTLLGQVDAAIGGKTAIDIPEGKNLAGAFHLPRAVFADTAWLDTLPDAEWRSGFGEILKTGLLAGGQLWETVKGARPPWGDVRSDPQALVGLIAPTAMHKVQVVNQDPLEQGVRAHLNLGHTIGHAYETLHGHGRIRHGEAVGVGLLGALALSEGHLGTSVALREATRTTLERWGMPTRVQAGSRVEALLEIMTRDKKHRGGMLRWILLKEPGTPVITEVAPDLVREVLRSLGAEIG